MLGIFLAAGAIVLLSVGMLALQAKRYFEELFHLGTRILREVRGESPMPRTSSKTPPAPATRSSHARRRDEANVELASKRTSPDNGSSAVT